MKNKKVYVYIFVIVLIVFLLGNQSYANNISTGNMSTTVKATATADSLAENSEESSTVTEKSIGEESETETEESTGEETENVREKSTEEGLETETENITDESSKVVTAESTDGDLEDDLEGESDDSLEDYAEETDGGTEEENDGDTNGSTYSVKTSSVEENNSIPYTGVKENILIGIITILIINAIVLFRKIRKYNF